MKKKYITSDFVAVVRESEDSFNKKKFNRAYTRIDRMDDYVMDGTNQDLVDAAKQMVSAVACIQKGAGKRLITRYLANDAQLAEFAMEAYDAVNESYANSIEDSYTVAK